MERIFLDYVLPCLWAFLACVGFTLVFNIHGVGKLICGFGGGLGWLVYLLAGSSIVAAQTAGSKAAQFLSVPLESIGTAMTTYASQNMGAHDLKRVNRGVNTALGIGCVYSVASFLILRVLDVPLISLFLESSEVEIMANARSFIFWNSVFYIPLAVLIIYRYTIQGLGYSGLAMFAGVAEMVARAMVGFWFVPLWGYFAACIANPVAWFFACFFLIPAYFAVRNRLMKENAYGVGD